MTAAPDIFLSYNREDAATAKLFADAFAAAGLNVWWDTALRSGEAYDEVTEAALRAAKAVVVLWSPRSVVSRWVRAEATIADRCKTLVPVTIEPCERPIMFELTQTADLSHWQGDAADRMWLALLDDVRRFVGQQRPSLPALPSLETVASKSEPNRETMIAVLPFDNLSSDSEMAYFSDGVSEDILGRIQRGSKLKVISHTSSFQFRGADKAKAAVALKASHVLDGSIRRGGAKVRIAATLTEVVSQTIIWSDKYDRGLDDIFAVQDEISEAIAEALNTAFFPVKTAAIDPAAYDLYLRVRETQIFPARLVPIIATMETVTRIAPDFANAWAELALMYIHKSSLMPYADRQPLLMQAKAALARCQALDPDNPVAAAGHWRLCNPFGDFLAQEDFSRRMRAVDQYSASAQSLLTYHLRIVGRLDEAVATGRQVSELDPKNMGASSLYSSSLWLAGHFAEGIAAMKHHLLLWPHDHHLMSNHIQAMVHQQDWAEVDRVLDPQRLAKYPLREHSWFIDQCTMLRSPEAASRRQLLEVLREKVAKTGHIDPVSMIFPAIAGFADEAYDILDTAKFGPNGGADDVFGLAAYRPSLCFAAAYSELRANPRFVKMCARLGLVEYWLATQKWPDCADTVPYDFRAECEKYRDYPKDVFLA